MSMRKKIWKNHITQRRYSKTCTDFYKSLYTQTVPTPESTMKSSLDIEEIPKFREEEVERAIKKDEKTQSPRMIL